MLVLSCQNDEIHLKNTCLWRDEQKIFLHFHSSCFGDCGRQRCWIRRSTDSHRCLIEETSGDCRGHRIWFKSCCDLYGSICIHRVSLLICSGFSCAICLCTRRLTLGRCPGEANVGYDPIQAALGISNDSNKASWIKSKSHMGMRLDWARGYYSTWTDCLRKATLCTCRAFAFQSTYVYSKFRQNSSWHDRAGHFIVMKALSMIHVRAYLSYSINSLMSR